MRERAARRQVETDTACILWYNHCMPLMSTAAPHRTVLERLNAALVACGAPPLRDANAFRRLGAGAWHDAYRVIVEDGQRLVVRLRKTMIYGSTEPYDEATIRSDYAGVGAYYAAANACLPGVCPTRYGFAIAPAASCTVESYLGPALALDRLTIDNACTIGREIGTCFRIVHDCPAPCGGWGELVWTPQGVRGEETRPRREIADAEERALREGFTRLAAAGVIAEPAHLEHRLHAALLSRRERREPPALVNSDITPENIIVRRGRFVGLIDPVPRIGSAPRYAAFFLLCYRLYLPSLHDAPRYARHGYDRLAPMMARMAEGYLKGYVRDDEPALLDAIWCEYFLWVLDLTMTAHAALSMPMTEERRIRTGGDPAIARRLRQYARELAAITQ
jgi:hypothetical protein